MKKKNLMSIIGLMFILFVSLFALSACGDNSYRTIKVFSCEGECNVLRNNNEISVQKDMLLKNNDELNVKANSQAILKLDNDKFVCAKENTSVKFVATGSKNKTKTRLHVNDGGIIVEVKEKLKNGEKFEIASSNSVMAIRGTQISFDVEKTSDSITTTFSILTGNTEIFLYKDETMNSTTLIQEYMMSYTTSLVKSTDEIYKIYDSTKHNEISDEDLENVYNVKKVRISNKKINEMVEAVNEFEKIDDEIVNGVIGFDIPNNITYKIDPSTVIDVLNENKYTDYDELEYLYSSSIDGTYSPYDINNPLDAGTYYCKIKAGNAYISDPIEFKVTEIVLNFQIASQVPYGSNPRDYITIDEAYSNMEIKYSQTQNGPFTIDANNLTRGAWYAKIVEKNYTSNPMKFTVSQASIPVSLKNNSIVYGTNPDNNVTVTGNYSNIRKLYSQSRTTGFSEYSTNNPLSVGTWYVKVTSGNEYVSEILEFSVTPAKITINLTSDSVVYGTNPNTIITINGTYSNVKYLYSTTETGEFKEFDLNNPLDAGFYYVKVVSGNEYISDILDFEITPKEITFNVEESIVYGTNPNTIITITNGNYPNSTYLYRKAGSTTDLEYDSSNPFEVGTWYVTVDNGSNYVSSRKSFEIVAKEIVYSLTSTTVPYGTNPNTIVTVSETYPTITYKYSTAENGPYNEYNANNPLTTGLYYIKLFINDNYYSVAKEFNVGKMSFNFTISSEIEYEDSIIDHITVDSMYTDLTYYYSTSESFDTSNVLDRASVLDPGTYYIKITSGTNYESVIKSFEVVRANVDFQLSNNGQIPYGDDLNDYIDDTFDRDIYISTSQTGRFDEYNSSNYYSLGTYYVKLENDYYTSTAKQISIIARDIELPLTKEQLFYNDTVSIKISLGNNVFLDSPYATEKQNGEYKYYISIKYVTGRGDEDFELYYLNYDNRECICSTSPMTIIYEFNLPEAFNVTNATRENVDFENAFEVANIEVDKTGYIRTSFNIYPGGSFSTLKAIYKLDNGSEQTEEITYSEYSYYLYISNLTDYNSMSIKYEYYYDDVFVGVTDYYTIDLTELDKTYDYDLNLSTANSFATYNSDGTINIYFDLGFVNNSIDNIVMEVTYGTYYLGEVDVNFRTRKKVLVDGRWLVLENLFYNDYAMAGLKAINLVNGISYLIYDYGDEDYYFEESSNMVSLYSTASPAYATIDSETLEDFDINARNTRLVDGSSVIVKVLDYDGNLTDTLTFNTFNPSNNDWSSSQYVHIGDTSFESLISYTEIMICSSSFVNDLLNTSYSGNVKITDAIFTDFVEAFSDEYGITIKGSSTIEIIDLLKFFEDESY